MEWSCQLQKNLYETMVKIRVFEEAVLEICSKEEIPGSSHLYIGQEAIAAGVCAALTESDQILTTYRGHGHCIARGGDMKSMMAEFYGRTKGYCAGRGGSLHISSRNLGMLGANGIVGAGSPIAVGAAFAQKYKHTTDLTAVFFGDGASNRGTQHEAMNLASVWKLPVIFIVENNRFGFYTHQKKHQNIEDISIRAAGYGFPGYTEDGNDVRKVLEVTEKATEYCRGGKGPVLLEFKTWRWGGHFAGDPGLYKDPAEQDYWVKKRDPIRNYGECLVAQGILDIFEADKIETRMRAQAEEAIEYAKSCPFPDVQDISVGTYGHI